MPPLPSEPVSFDGALLMGSKGARLVVIAYSDVQCPFCGTFARDTLPAFEQEFVKTGKVLFAFRHFPLEQLHPAARQAAQAIECADKQGKAWSMHDRLFEKPRSIEQAIVARSIQELGLNTEAFEACMNGPAASQVAADLASGQALGVTGTPTFFIGEQLSNQRAKLLERIPGAVPIAQWERSLKAWLKDMESR